MVHFKECILTLQMNEETSISALLISSQVFNLLEKSNFSKHTSTRRQIPEVTLCSPNGCTLILCLLLPIIDDYVFITIIHNEVLNSKVLRVRKMWVENQNRESYI